jgi:NADP-dependent 3-hydroxy acid dehydrogenase YdfG
MKSGSLAVADLYTVNGLVAVVTGGATGLGLMMAKALEANGAKVYILGRRKVALEEAAKQSVSADPSYTPTETPSRSTRHLSDMRKA